MIKPGEVIYFKRGSTSTRWPKKDFEFKGHGYAMFIGHVPPKVPDPPKPLILNSMGAAGFVLFDDVIEHFGAEAAEAFRVKWQEKYTKLINEFVEKAVEEKRIKLVDNFGKPVDTESLKTLITPDGKPIESAPVGEPEYHANSEEARERGESP